MGYLAQLNFQMSFFIVDLKLPKIKSIFYAMNERGLSEIPCTSSAPEPTHNSIYWLYLIIPLVIGDLFIYLATSKEGSQIHLSNCRVSSRNHIFSTSTDGEGPQAPVECWILKSTIPCFVPLSSTYVFINFRSNNSNPRTTSHKTFTENFGIIFY